MKTTLLLILYFFATLPLSLAAPVAESRSGDKGNGGDEVGLEFTESFRSALSFLKASNPGLYGRISSSQGLATRAKVLAVEEDLPTELGGLVQNAVAVNYRSTLTIRVNRFRWSAISNPFVKEAVALHEYLGLAGLEGTGDYRYSAGYLAARKLDASVLATGAVSMADDFRMNGLKASPEYALALLEATKGARRGGFSTVVSSAAVRCEERAQSPCLRGEVRYEIFVYQHDNDGAFEFRQVGSITATVGFVNDPEAETVGAWVTSATGKKI